MKLFDISSFDVIHMVKLDFTPSACEFVHKKTAFSPLLAIADTLSPKIKLLKAEQSQSEKKSAVVVELSIHESPVRLIKFNPVYNLAVSTD
jgi:peptidylprolyl isomerase domain and WD repeat-containing protein 1